MPDEDIRKKLDIKTVATTIGIVVMVGGLIGQWFTYKATLTDLQKDYTKLEQSFSMYKEKTDERIINMKLDITSSSSDITTIKADIREIKGDVKTLLTRPR